MSMQRCWRVTKLLNFGCNLLGSFDPFARSTTIQRGPSVPHSQATCAGTCRSPVFHRRVSNQNAIPHHAAENNEVIIAEGVIGTASGTLSMRPLKVTLFGAGAALAGGRAASSRRGGWPEPSGVELLVRLAIVADSLASARPSEPAFAAMAIPAKNAVPRPMDLPIVGISYL
jgi:hypothetical protein